MIERIVTNYLFSETRNGTRIEKNALSQMLSSNITRYFTQFTCLFKYLLILICFACTTFLTACTDNQDISLPGYIDGKFTYISSSYSGKLKKLYVAAGQQVNANQPLFILEEFPEQEDFQAANARMAEAADMQRKAMQQYGLEKKQFNRQRYLYNKGVISKDEFQTSLVAYQQASAEVKAAEANSLARKADRDKAEWASKQKIVNAPVSSLVFDTYYSEGEFVQNGIPVLSLLPESQVKVVFFVASTQLSNIRLNQTVDVQCDHCKTALQAKITYISNKAEYTPPVIYSNEQRAKLVYRVDATLLNNIFQVHPGQPVSVLLKSKNRN